MSQDLQMKRARMSLKTLQRSSSERDSLVGRPSTPLKHQLRQDSPGQLEVKKKTLSTIETQTDSEISVEDLTNPDRASEAYWKTLAENRRVALQEALVENEKLHNTINDLEAENAVYIQMLNEANSFVEVIKEELANANKDDTGIDVNDVSTADETFDSPDDDDAAERGSNTT